jgi:hypothetical protein
MLIIIDNLNYGYHFETIESLINKYHLILKIPKNNNFKICLDNISCDDYINYIKNKYPEIKINCKIKNFNYKIYSTFYPKLINKYKNELLNNKIFFICHSINGNTLQYKNIYYITPLCKNKQFIYADILPEINKISTEYPIYVIQGSFTDKRRNYRLLVNILKHNYDKEFKFKFLGRGKFPKILIPFKSKIIIEESLNFLDYHNAFSDCYCILPLITKTSHPQYYKNKLTSTISYAMAYNLKCIIDKDLQKIYKLKNVEIFNNENDIEKAFIKSLNYFYENKNNL